MGSTTIDGSAVVTNDYSSVSDVVAFTKYMLEGQSTFNSTTRPTATEVTRFLTKASGLMNSALRGVGLAIPVTQADAKAAIDDWVTERAVQYVELTQRGVGYSEQDGSRQRGFRTLARDVDTFVKKNRLAFVRFGATCTNALAEGLQFTGQDAVANRLDPSDSGMAQPMFERGLFNTPGTGLTTSDTPDEEDEA